jgi:hypothetical protein
MRSKDVVNLFIITTPRGRVKVPVMRTGYPRDLFAVRERRRWVSGLELRGLLCYMLMSVPGV